LYHSEHGGSLNGCSQVKCLCSTKRNPCDVNLHVFPVKVRARPESTAVSYHTSHPRVYQPCSFPLYLLFITFSPLAEMALPWENGSCTSQKPVLGGDASVSESTRGLRSEPGADALFVASPTYVGRTVPTVSSGFQL